MKPDAHELEYAGVEAGVVFTDKFLPAVLGSILKAEPRIDTRETGENWVK